MKQTLYFVEVGVLLDHTDKEYEYYKINGFHDTIFGFYDENKLTFLTLKEAKEYADNYIKDGVNKTYAIIYSFVCNIDDNDLEEITQHAYCEYSLEPPQLDTTLYFAYKNDYKLNIVTEIVLWNYLN